MAGDEWGLDVSVAIHHVFQYLLQARERGFAGDVIGRADFLFGNQGKGFAHAIGRVMERGLQSDFRVVQAVGIELNLAAFGAAAEEIDGATFADHFCGPSPSFGTSDGFNDYVGATVSGRQRAYRLNGILYRSDVHDIMSPHAAGGLDLGLALDYGDHVASDGLCDVNKHQANGAAANYGYRVADFSARFVKSAQHAGHPLTHPGFSTTTLSLNTEHVQ